MLSKKKPILDKSELRYRTRNDTFRSMGIAMESLINNYPQMLRIWG